MLQARADHRLREKTFSDVCRPLLPLDNSLNKDFGIVNHNACISDDDVFSLQPGQIECQGMGLLSSEGSD